LKTDSTDTNWAELGRVVGFAYTPGVLVLLSFLPGIGGIMGFIAFVWTLVAVVIAIRHALDFEGTGRAIVVAGITGVLGFIPWVILRAIQGGVASS
ncbi:MAG: YIP1 family protein, partial [Chloroflexi bacterium]|nr:YIP1 family protein [Chloroflexota bacterium]